MTSLTSALNPDGGAGSTASLASSYQVPVIDGRMALATPLKFCLNFRQPTIAVVYTLDKSKRVKNGKPRKYIHEIRVDFEKCMVGEGRRNRKPLSPSYPSKPTMSEVSELCRKLCEAEPTYLNINIISKTQVRSKFF